MSALANNKTREERRSSCCCCCKQAGHSSSPPRRSSHCHCCRRHRHNVLVKGPAGWLRISCSLGFFCTNLSAMTRAFSTGTTPKDMLPVRLQGGRAAAAATGVGVMSCSERSGRIRYLQAQRHASAIEKCGTKGSKKMRRRRGDRAIVLRRGREREGFVHRGYDFERTEQINQTNSTHVNTASMTTMMTRTTSSLPPKKAMTAAAGDPGAGAGAGGHRRHRLRAARVAAAPPSP